MSSIDETLPTQEINSMLNLPDIINDIDKVPSYGSVPKGWCAMRFGDIATIGQGQVSPLSEPYRNQLHIGPENIESSTGRLTGLKTAEELGLISGKYAFDQDAIVYSKIRPNLNKVCTPDFAGTCSADAYPIWPCPDVVDKAYLTYFMRSSVFVKQAVRTSMRSGMPKINRDDLVNIWLLLPPLDEQLAIADILKHWEKANGIQNDLIAAKLAYKTALAELLLTGKRRFPEFAGQEWQEIKLGAALVESRPLSPNSHPNQRITVKLHLEGVIQRTVRGIEERQATVYYTRQAGQLIYGKQNLHRGAIGIVPEHLNGYASSQDVPAFDWQEGFCPTFIVQSISRKHFYEGLERLAMGTGSKRIHPEVFLKTIIKVPFLPEQRRVADVLELMDQEISLLKRQLAAQKRQKEELMQMLLTGQKRVKEFAT